jgi:hypothetical protein
LCKLKLKHGGIQLKTAKEAYNQHLRRMKKAIALEKTDRIPVLIRKQKLSVSVTTPGVNVINLN